MSARVESGQIRIVDFSTNKPPEMTKRWRPVVVLAKTEPNLFTVVALSTTPPDHVRGFHYRLPSNALPGPWRSNSQAVWAKGNQIFAVAERRLERLPIKRFWWSFRLPDSELRAIREAVRRGLAL